VPTAEINITTTVIQPSAPITTLCALLLRVRKKSTSKSTGATKLLIIEAQYNTSNSPDLVMPADQVGSSWLPADDLN